MSVSVKRASQEKLAMKSAQVKGDILFNEPLARFTTWRVGGPAECLFVPADLADLVAFLKSNASNKPLFWLGLGSNLLIRDGGIAATVIHTRGRLKTIQSTKSRSVYFGAGVPCVQAARYCALKGLSGVEFFIGIPGTIGGALAMNAGAFGAQTWDRVVRVETINAQGELNERMPSDFAIGYRKLVGPKNEWFVGAEMELQQQEPSKIQTKMNELLAKRSDSQPVNVATCGSVFKNPANDYAARLIEFCGLKGHRIGGAYVSERHANFIVNSGNATAADIENLIFHIRNKVVERCQVEMELEVKIIGDHGVMS